MIRVENIQVFGMDPAFRGMRNPLNSWHKADSQYKKDDVGNVFFEPGENDWKLAQTLAGEGAPNRKFLRMINAWMDITAPLYWWKEFDTYKVGTVADSCSTMHTIHSRPFCEKDFSTEHLNADNRAMMAMMIGALENARQKYLQTRDKEDWWQLIQMLPSSYNQKRTVMLNYETLAQMLKWRNNHKLDEWRMLCAVIRNMPASGLIEKAAGLEEKHEV